jgi:nitroreductase/NAD-dependent dihydropyrimidine dehydrogenase PreA subunit
MLFTVDPVKCNRCGICVEACGPLLIEMQSEGALPTPVTGGEILCIDCGHCVAVCPTGALSRDSMAPEECPEIQERLFISEEQAEQFFRSRRSIRSYQSRPVEREKLARLVQVAGYAPSAHNDRPVHLVATEDPVATRHLSGMVIDWMRLVLEETPAVAQSYRFDRLVRYWDNGKDLISRNAPHLIIAHAPEKAGMAREDCVLALAYMELAAGTLGLGATWAGYIMAAVSASPPLVESIGLPESHKCHGVLMIGYPRFKYARLPVRHPPAVAWRGSV